MWPKLHFKLAHKGLPQLSEYLEILLDIVGQVLLDITIVSSSHYLETVRTLDQRDLKSASDLDLDGKHPSSNKT